MTLPTTDSSFTYDGDASETEFSFPRKVIEASHLVVYLYDEDDDSYALQTLNTHYTFAGTGLSNGVYASATITFSTAPGADKKVVIRRAPTLTQEQSFSGSESNVLSALDRLADRIEMKLQRMQDQIDRSIKLPDGDYAPSWGNAATKLDYASALLGFNASGVPMPSNGTSTVAISAAMTPVVQAASINAASTIIDNVTDSPVAIAATPVTNPAFETKSGRWLTGETKEENKREFLDSVEFISSKGSTEATNLQDKVARFTAMQMKAGSGDGWVTNELLVIDASVGNKSAHITEADINNNNQHYGDGLAALGLVAPTCLGHHVTGFSAFNTTSAYMVSMSAGSTGFHNRGFTVGPTSVLQSAFENHSDCDVAFANYGNPDYVLYSGSATSDAFIDGNVGLGALPDVGFKLNVYDVGAARQALTGTTQALYRFRDTGATDDYEIIDIDVDDGVLSFIARTNAGAVRNTPLVVDTINNRVIAAEMRLGNTGLRLADTNASHHLIVAPGSNITADRTLTVTTGDADHTIDVSGLATTGVFADGTYTPTLTSVANVDGSTAYACQYSRVGNTVTVSGKADINPTSAAADTKLGISLPIASDFSAAPQCAGIVTSPGTNGYGWVHADATNNRAETFFVPGADSNQEFYFHFTYRII